MAFLNNNQIPTLYHLNGDSHEVHIRDEHHLPTAHTVAQAFVKDPNHPRFQQAAWESGAPASLNTQFSIASLSGHIKQLMFSPVTASILFLALVVHLIVFGLGIEELQYALKFQPWFSIEENNEFWRLITPAIIHYSMFHIVFNLLWWWILGKDIEKTFGSILLLAVFVVSALASNYGQFLMSGPNFGGLSGVVYALLGFVWWLGWLKPELGLSIPKAIVGFMLIWLVLGYADILWVSVANTAHTVGLISGCLMARLLVWYLNYKT